MFSLLLPLRTDRTEIKCAGTSVLVYAGVLHLPWWCRPFKFLCILHSLCRLKNPTVILIWLLVGFHPATRSVQSTPANNTRKRVWQYIEKERKKEYRHVHDIDTNINPTIFRLTRHLSVVYISASVARKSLHTLISNLKKNVKTYL